MISLRNIHTPVIAQVSGLATAAGCQLVASCDLAICSEDAEFSTPGVKLGFFCTTPGVALGRAINNHKKALEMLLTGKTISATEALSLGLVNKVVPKDKLKETTDELAQTISQYSSDIIKLGKQAYYHQMNEELPKAYAFAEQVMVSNLSHSHAQEGINAFLEKESLPGHQKWVFNNGPLLSLKQWLLKFQFP